MPDRKMFVERNLESEHAAYLRRRFEAWAVEQPEASQLREILLTLDGLEIVAPPNQWEHDIAALIANGYLINFAHVLQPMEDNGCHENSATLFRKERSENFGIGTGWALSNDLWRQHSWCVSGTTLIETTVFADRYFGILLYGEDAEVFCKSILG